MDGVYIGVGDAHAAHQEDVEMAADLRGHIQCGLAGFLEVLEVEEVPAELLRHFEGLIAHLSLVRGEHSIEHVDADPREQSVDGADGGDDLPADLELAGGEYLPESHLEDENEGQGHTDEDEHALAEMVRDDPD